MYSRNEIFSEKAEKGHQLFWILEK